MRSYHRSAWRKNKPKNKHSLVGWYDGTTAKSISVETRRKNNKKKKKGRRKKEKKGRETHTEIKLVWKIWNRGICSVDITQLQPRKMSRISFVSLFVCPETLHLIWSRSKTDVIPWNSRNKKWERRRASVAIDLLRSYRQLIIRSCGIQLENGTVMNA